MRPALWLATRELAVRWRRVALAVAVVAALAAAATAIELVGRAREVAVASRVDAMGAALTVVPEGVTAGMLARYQLADRTLPPGVAGAVARALGAELRETRARLVLTPEIAGSRAPLAGVPQGDLPPAVRGAGRVALGSALAERLGAVPGVSIAGRTFEVSAVLPPTGSVEDVAAFVPLATAQEIVGREAVNELRIYLRAGASPLEAERRLRAAAVPGVVVRWDRGEVADGEAHASLALHRRLAYLLLAGVAALCLLITSHLDTAERRVEVATLVAIGARRWTVIGALVVRSGLVAAAGALAGVGAGLALAVAQDTSAATGLAGAWPVSVATVALALVLGIAAATPAALAAARRDPVPELQD